MNERDRRKAKRKREKRIFAASLCVLICLVTVAVIAGIYISRKQDGGKIFDSVTEKTENGAVFSATERTENETAFTGTDNGQAETDNRQTDTDNGQAQTENGQAETDNGQNETDSDTVQTNSISADITARNAIVVEADSGLVLYQKDSKAQIAPASTAKMITALTALDVCPEEEEITVGAEIKMMNEDSSRAWLEQGDIMTVRQLLIALMLPSGNDAAYALSVHTGRKIAGDSSLAEEQAVGVFMDAANKKARALGAKNSNFVAPDGYDAEGQYTTASDLAVLAKACLAHSCIAKIVASNISYEKWVSDREVTYYNTNALLNPDSAYYYPEAIGIKTGTSDLAGASLVSAAVINGKTYISVVMGAETDDSRFQDSITIYDAIKSL